MKGVSHKNINRIFSTQEQTQDVFFRRFWSILECTYKRRISGTIYAHSFSKQRIKKPSEILSLSLQGREDR